MSLKQLIVKTQPQPSAGRIAQIQTIGSGTYSSVFSVETPQGVMVAKRFDDSDNLPKIQKEVMVLAGFKSFHNLMHIDDFLTYNDRFFIISPYYGKALDIAAPYSLKQIKHIMAQLLYALALLAALRISHRDVKPENVLLDAGRLTLIDFGLSLPISQLRQRAGTMQYQPPENFLYGISTQSSDVFSAGVLLLNMLRRRKMLYSASREDHFETLQKYSAGFAEYARGYAFQGLEKQKMEQAAHSSLHERVQAPEAAEMLEQMLQADPGRRASAQQCLNAEFMSEARNELMGLPYLRWQGQSFVICEQQVEAAFRMGVGEFMARKRAE